MSSVKSLSTTDVLRTPDLSEEEISAYLIVKFGARVFHVLREPASRVTQQFKTHRVMIIKEAYPQLSGVDDLENAILLDDKLTGNPGPVKSPLNPHTVSVVLVLQRIPTGTVAENCSFTMSPSMSHYFP